MIELIGYLASALVAVSLVMTNVWRLRLLNFIGASVFVVYGVAGRVYPVIAVNLFIAAVDLYYIMRMSTGKDIFKFMPVDAGDPLLDNFLAYHARDIRKFFPDFSIKKIAGARCVFILRNLMPVGLFVYTEAAGSALIHLDYVITDYRDLKNARYLYNRPQNRADFKDLQYFTAAGASPAHASYLRKIGFSEDPQTAGRFIKRI
jgi:hypothetical protein